jgi:hypothetical protein
LGRDDPVAEKIVDLIQASETMTDAEWERLVSEADPATEPIVGLPVAVHGHSVDDLEDVNLTPELLNEIVLWKVNRHVALDGDQLHRIDALRKLKPGEHRQARSVLEELLDAHGVDLPMASTILRFRKQHRRRLSGKRLLPSCRSVGSTPEVWRIAAPTKKVHHDLGIAFRRLPTFAPKTTAAGTIRLRTGPLALVFVTSRNTALLLPMQPS